MSVCVIRCGDWPDTTKIKRQKPLVFKSKGVTISFVRRFFYRKLHSKRSWFVKLSHFTLHLWTFFPFRDWNDKV